MCAYLRGIANHCWLWLITNSYEDTRLLLQQKTDHCWSLPEDSHVRFVKDWPIKMGRAEIKSLAQRMFHENAGVRNLRLRTATNRNRSITRRE